ncbi:discoidin domain-containing protein [uncultured Bacteroides sp.]|uniref:discoidin domain-containing protein n=1 Tax=uncultured Bacteroides sp. TaxID=162156 RepID=UPI0025EAF077|nr:discoidin domain-containing protein [uncultured Bacteroides sp.]
MNTIKYITNYSFWMACALFAVLFAACDDDETSGLKVNRLMVADVADGTISLIEGDTYNTSVTTLPADAIDAGEYTYTYTTGNDKVFTVDESGVITATGVGEAVLSVWSVNNTDLWTTCLVKVEKRIYPITSITVPEVYKDYYVGMERTINLGATVSVLPENASNPDVIYLSSDPTVAEVNEYGEVYTKSFGDVTITIKSTDGSNVATTCDFHVCNVEYTNYLERSAWTVETSHQWVSDAAAGGQPEKMFDNDTVSSILLVKPGKSLGGVTVPSTDVVHFTIDMQTPQTFDFFKLTHRTNNTSENLRVKKVSVYGSNDNEEFTELLKGADIPVAKTVGDVIVDLPMTVTYRYFKITLDAWSNSGNTMQISEFNIGKMNFIANE